VIISFADIRNGIGDKDCYLTKHKKMSSKIPQATMTLKQVLCKCGFYDLLKVCAVADLRCNT
jgi:hypothetical protein